MQVGSHTPGSADTRSKSFSTDNAFKTHIQSKKHRDREAALKDQPGVEASSSSAPPQASNTIETFLDDAGDSQDEEEEEDEEEDEGEIEERLAAARRRIRPSDCLFCPVASKTVKDNVSHMSRYHSFFIPDQEILTDLSGLLSYLGEKVVLGNLCLYCPNGGKEFGDVEAVRKHMIDKSHCKLAYETDEDRAELADYYDFKTVGQNDSDWEEVDDEEMDGEVVEIEVRHVDHLVTDLQESGITMAPDGLSLMLPSGRTLGHRSLRVYYTQRLRPATVDAKGEALSAKIKQLRANLADPSQALVPVAGGHGAYGKGLQVMKARNAGEAKWAKQQARSFKDQRAREAHKTRVGFVHNNQKREQLDLYKGYS